MVTRVMEAADTRVQSTVVNCRLRRLPRGGRKGTSDKWAKETSTSKPREILAFREIKEGILPLVKGNQYSAPVMKAVDGVGKLW